MKSRMRNALGPARRLIRELGFDVVRYPLPEPLSQLPGELKRRGVTTLIDVGANDGGYAKAMRRHGFSGRILSFEPITEAFNRLAENSSNDAQWFAHQVALGANTGQADINVAGNSAASSSFKPMLDRHKAAAPVSEYIGVEQVEVRRLQSFRDLIGTPHQAFLKLDTQGSELEVIEGAVELLGEDGIAGLQIELSLLPLYESAPLWNDVMDVIVDFGYYPTWFQAGFRDPDRGDLLQIDMTAFRSPNPIGS